MADVVLHGVHSSRAAVRHGMIIYSKPDGSTTGVTAVFRLPVGVPFDLAALIVNKEYYSDAIYLGVVTEFVPLHRYGAENGKFIKNTA